MSEEKEKNEKGTSEKSDDKERSGSRCCYYVDPCGCYVDSCCAPISCCC
jgi:hypothetical protein